MFTRAQSTARTTPPPLQQQQQTKGVAGATTLFKTLPTSGTNGSTTTIEIPVTSVIPVGGTSVHEETVIPSVSLTITAVATELDIDGRITTTTEVPVLDTPTITNLVVSRSAG